MLVKPDVVFFGENLPDRFFDTYPDDVAMADLLIVAGTSMNVYPFASLAAKVGKEVGRYVINMTAPEGVFRFRTQRDWLLLGDCQTSIRAAVEQLSISYRCQIARKNHWLQSDFTNPWAGKIIHSLEAMQLKLNIVFLSYSGNIFPY